MFEFFEVGVRSCNDAFPPPGFLTLSFYKTSIETWVQAIIMKLLIESVFLG
jgi:hypothetical protein